LGDCDNDIVIDFSSETKDVSEYLQMFTKWYLWQLRIPRH